VTKGYRIVRADVSDPDDDRNYIAAIAILFAKCGVKFLGGGGKSKMRASAVDRVIVEGCDGP
jgi:uncharacterized protein (DUF1330 family)